ncbi:MAG TPA: trypsin-like peptidase domain-containing protein [Vicinamibacterales bacterium]|nr:trypsin-like peptidase domain-containing protein [Vicinamibacterales bacterium]
MSSRKPSLFSLPRLTLFYLPLIVLASIAVGMVIASRLDLSPSSSAQTIALPPMNSAPLTGPLSADTFRTIAKAQAPMVVNIRTEMKGKAQDLEGLFGGGSEDFFRRFFGGPGGGQGQGQGQGDDDNGGNTRRRRQREPIQRAAGSGFIINAKEGFILTNNHVVEDATKIEVLLYADDETTYSAKVIGRDVLTDSALIQLTEKPNTPLAEARFGDSSQMQPGDWVMAIGNPFSLAHTISVGVISATKRPFQVTDQRSNEMLQTDAAINPGNSGGPLLNIRGEVIGINTAIISNGQSEGNIGIGFAVPINTVRDLLPQLREGKVIRGRIGVSVGVVPREGYEEFGLRSRTGAIVSSVLPNSAAQKAGMEPGDVVLEYNGRPVPNRDELVKMVVATKPGTSVPVKILRNKQERTLTVVVEQLDLDAENQKAQNSRGNNQREDNAETQGSGFGLTLSNLTPQASRRLQLPSGRTGALISDVDPDGPAAQSGVRPGDVILQVNRKAVTNPTEAARELQAVASGHLAQVLLWRADSGSGPTEIFVTVKKD